MCLPSYLLDAEIFDISTLAEYVDISACKGFMYLRAA